MKAKQAFDFNMERARNLVTLYERRRKAGVGHAEIADLLRASVVLAVGAVDAYVHDKVSESLVPFIKRALRNKPNDLEPIEKLLKQAEVQTREYLAWLTLDRPFVKVRQVVDSRLGSMSLQKPGIIQTAFLLIGKRDVLLQCAAVMEQEERDVSSQLAALADRRNKIVHEGDREKSRLKKHQRRPIDLAWVQKQLEFTEQFVASLEQVK